MKNRVVLPPFFPSVSLLAAVALLTGVSSKGNAQTIPNPSFEAQAFGGGVGYAGENGGAIAGWTLSDPNHIGLNTSNFPFADNGTIPNGANIAFIQAFAGQTNSLSTTISGLTVGEKYQVSFRANSRSASSVPSPTWSLNDGEFVAFTAGPPVGGANSYYLNLGTFTATDTTAPLVLRNVAGDDATVLLDDFKIALAGVWSVNPWADDTSSGISPAETAWAYHFGSSAAAVVNGVSVPGLAGANPSIAGKFSVAGFTSVSNEQSNSLTALGGSGSAEMAKDFIESGSTGTVTLQGLTVGQIYTLSLYGVGYDASPPARESSFANDLESILVNENSFGQGNGMRVDYRFTAAATTNVTTITPAGALSFHLYGLSLNQADFAASPVVTNTGTAALGADALMLNATVNPRNLATSTWFEWGVTTDYGNSSAPTALPASNVAQSVSNSVTGLAPLSIYHYRIVASNALGTTYGPDQVFKLQSFTPVPVSGLPGGSAGSVAWGDYDNDGLLDLLITGSFDLVSQIWRNTGDGFVDVTNAVAPGLPGVRDSSVAWGDYDNDGRLDFLITGHQGDLNPFSQIWRNTGSGFVHVTNTVAPGLPGVLYSSVAWGDYDNDGRLDFLLTGYDGNRAISQIWHNTGHGFENVTSALAAGLPGVSSSSVAWGDYNNDGWLDFLVSGALSNGPLTQIWQNTGDGFVNVTNVTVPGMRPVHTCSVAWGDYDNDGWLDFLLTGDDTINGATVRIWRNTGSGFVNVTTAVAPGLTGVFSSSVAWADYDNDGRLDFLLTGQDDSSSSHSQIWRNTGSGFVNMTIAIANGIPGVSSSSVAWADYDNDGWLDFLLTGSTGGGETSQLWRNAGSGLPDNTPPTQPAGLSVASGSSGLTFSWGAASDGQTPAAGLSYHLRVGTTPGGTDLFAPMAAADGTSRLPRTGALQPSLSRTVKGLPIGQPVYWSVQATDTSFAGSPFSDDHLVHLAGTPILTANGPFVPGDTNGDGVLSQAEFDAVRTHLADEVASQNAAGFYSADQLQALKVDAPLLSQVAPGQFKLTLGLQKSTTLTDFEPFPMFAPESTINDEGRLEFFFTAPDRAAFYRIEAK